MHHLQQMIAVHTDVMGSIKTDEALTAVAPQACAQACLQAGRSIRVL